MRSSNLILSGYEDVVTVFRMLVLVFQKGKVSTPRNPLGKADLTIIYLKQTSQK